MAFIYSILDFYKLFNSVLLTLLDPGGFSRGCSGGADFAHHFEILIWASF